MQNKEIYSEILESIVTKNEHSQVLSDLTKLISFGDMNGFVESGKLSEIGINLYESLKPYIKDDRINVSELREIESEIAKMGCVYLKLAFYPQVKLVKEIHRNLVETINKYVYIDITIDAMLLGGLQIEYEGQFFDGSLRKIIDENFEKKKEKILKLIK